MSAFEDLSLKVLSAVSANPPLRFFLLDLARETSRAGGRAFLVGGTVRDILEGRPAGDVDIMIAGLPDPTVPAVLSALPAAAHGILRISKVGKTFPVLKVRTTWASGEIDVAAARRAVPDRGAARRKTRGRSASPDRNDASLRDFTINSLQLLLRARGDSLEGILQDPEGGARDIARRRIRTVGAPEDRFREDPLRMLRAIRLRAERDGYAIDRATRGAIRRMARALLPSLPRDRVAVELSRALWAAPAKAASDLSRSGILEALLPWTGGGRASTDRLVRRMEILERSREAFDGPTPFLAALFVERADAEGAAAAAPLRKAVGAGTLDRRVFRIPDVAADIAALRLPQARVITRFLEGHLVLAHSRLLRNRRAQLEAEFSRWREPGLLLSFHAAAQKARGERETDFRRILRSAAALPILVTGRDLLDAGFPEGPEIDRALEEIREDTLSGRTRTRSQALATARRLLRALPPGVRSGVECFQGGKEG